MKFEIKLKNQSNFLACQLEYPYIEKDKDRESSYLFVFFVIFFTHRSSSPTVSNLMRGKRGIKRKKERERRRRKENRRKGRAGKKRRRGERKQKKGRRGKCGKTEYLQKEGKTEKKNRRGKKVQDQEQGVPIGLSTGNRVDNSD